MSPEENKNKLSYFVLTFAQKPNKNPAIFVAAKSNICLVITL